jgi:hypothetical protein
MGDDRRGERQKRLAEALKANLKRRKAQQRERSADRGSGLPSGAAGEATRLEESG